MKLPPDWDVIEPFPSHADIMEGLRRMRQSTRVPYKRQLEERRKAKVVPLGTRLDRARAATRLSRRTVAHRVLEAMHEEARAALKAGHDIPEWHPGRRYILDADKDCFGELETPPPRLKLVTEVEIDCERADHARGPGGQSTPADDEE